MKLQRPLRTDRRLWLVFGIVSFVLLGFVSPWTAAIEYKVGPGDFWGMIAAGRSLWERWEFIGILGVYASVLAVTAAIVGWVTQAIVVAIRTPSPQREAAGVRPT